MSRYYLYIPLNINRENKYFLINLSQGGFAIRKPQIMIKGSIHNIFYFLNLNFKWKNILNMAKYFLKKVQNCFLNKNPKYLNIGCMFLEDLLFGLKFIGY